MRRKLKRKLEEARREKSPQNDQDDWTLNHIPEINIGGSDLLKLRTRLIKAHVAETDRFEWRRAC